MVLVVVVPVAKAFWDDVMHSSSSHGVPANQLNRWIVGHVDSGGDRQHDQPVHALTRSEGGRGVVSR